MGRLWVISCLLARHGHGCFGVQKGAVMSQREHDERGCMIGLKRIYSYDLARVFTRPYV